ncbi:MAG: transcriptional antiterminator, Rof [Gammaproteobacteria bacterium]|nr:transcriptional antiterminator, Rof [Gammaproteobacteria bacterium]
MNDDGYIPVSCERHSEYELAVMRGQSLNITWQDDHGEPQSETLKPYDLLTEQKREYLLARNPHGGHKKIRLDRITGAHPITNE